MTVGEVVLGAAGDVMIYAPTAFPPDGEVRVRNLSTSADAKLENASRTGFSRDGVTSAWIYGEYVSKPATGCTPNCILRWPIAGGEPTPLLSDLAHPFKVVANGRYAAWISDGGNTALTLHDAMSGTTDEVITLLTVGTQILDFDMTVVSGTPVVYYWSGPSAAGLPVRDVTLYRWTAAGGSQQVEAFANTNSPTGVDPKFAPQVSADADHVAYNTWTPAGAIPAAVSTVIRPTTGGAATTIGSRPQSLQVRNGVAVWWENFPTSGGAGTPDTRAWSAARGAETLQVADPYVGKLTLAPGFAVYGSGGGTSLYSWNSTTGVKTKLTDGPALNFFATEGWVYYYGGSHTYRVRLTPAP